MTNLIRIFRAPLALLLAAALLCSLCGCSMLYDEQEFSEILGASDPEQVPEQDVVDGEKVFSLSYYTEEDLNPYTASSRTNSELLRLCYSGLFSVDRTYNPVPVIAERWDVEGNTVFIHLRSGVRFSDGSPVTAADCVASFNLAFQKNSVWRDHFAYIRSYDAVDEDTFKIVFSSYSRMQLNLLTIPIVKATGTDSAGYPVGCGRYRFSMEPSFGLVRADCGVLAGDYAVESVSLLGIADREALIYNFNYGRLQAVCADLSLGVDEYRSDCELVTVPTNRLTFLVVNKSRPELSGVNFSRGITYLLDRTALVSQACGSFASPVWSPLNPSWSVTSDAGLNPDIRAPLTASEAFDAAGLLMEGTNRVYDKKPVVLRLLVNRENSSRVKCAELIASALREVGFAVDVISVTWDEYLAAINNLDFDLYLGEVNLPLNMDLSSLYTSQVCNTGEVAGTYDALISLGKQVLSESLDARSFVSSFQESLPFVPLYYSQDALAVGMDVKGTFGQSVSELYWNIENWTFTKS